jgi:hypothetical protein
MMRMQRTTPRRAAWRVAVAVLALAVAAACTQRGDQVPRSDSGSVAPPDTSPSGRGHPDLSTTPGIPDSGSGAAQRTERPGIAGDSSGRSHEESSAVVAPRARKDTQP